MKKLTSALFALALAISAGQALAVNVVNNTKLKIETRHIPDEDLDGFAVTIDGAPVVPGTFYIMINQAGEPIETLLEIANEVPLFPTTASKVEFYYSDLCVGSASGDVVEIALTLKGKTELFCLAKYEDGKVYAMFPFSGF